MLNKKVLAAAIVGSLFAAGNAAAVDFTVADPATTVAKFAREIKVDATTGTAFSGAGLEVRWESGYAYSPGEVRYVRVEAAPHVKFGTFTPEIEDATGAPSTALVPGNVNGVGTNVITFSITAGSAGAAADLVIELPVVADLTAAAGSTVAVSLYDQPSQAQAGGETGRIAGASVAGGYFTFADSLRWALTAGTAVADVEANPSFTRFVGGTTSATLTTGLTLESTGTLTATSASLPVAGLINTTTSTVTILGDFSYVASAGNAFDAAAQARVQAFGVGANLLTATSARFPLGTALTGNFTVNKLAADAWNPAIPATTYTARLNAVPTNTNTYNVPVLADGTIGTITRNGTELQAPFVQVPTGWIARIALSNTSGTERPYNISVLSANADGGTALVEFDLDNAIKTGTIPANGTKVIRLNDASLAAGNRGSVIVNIAAPSNAVQGLYQVVNPNTGLVTNHVMVRPDTN